MGAAFVRLYTCYKQRFPSEITAWNCWYLLGRFSRQLASLRHAHYSQRRAISLDKMRHWFDQKVAECVVTCGVKRKCSAVQCFSSNFLQTMCTWTVCILFTRYFYISRSWLVISCSAKRKRAASIKHHTSCFICAHKYFFCNRCYFCWL